MVSSLATEEPMILEKDIVCLIDYKISAMSKFLNYK